MDNEHKGQTGFSLVEQFMGYGGHKAIEIAEFILKYQLMHIVVLGATAAITGQLANRAIKRGELRGNMALIGETFYTPSGETNPATGEEWIDQTLRTRAEDFNLRHVFHPKVSRKLSKILGQAAKLCTPEEPIVFSHIAEVVDPKEFPAIKEMISKQWRNYFSARLKGSDEDYYTLKNREYFEEDMLLPLLVHKESSEYSQFRTLYIPLSMLKPAALPKAANMRVETGYDIEKRLSTFEHNSAHEANQRLRTNEGIRRTILCDVEGWINDWGVKFPTGKILTRPDFVPAAFGA